MVYPAVSSCAWFDEDYDGRPSFRQRKVLGIVENPDVLDLFYEVPNEPTTGEPLVSVEIVNSGVHTHPLEESELYKINKTLSQGRHNFLVGFRKNYSSEKFLKK